MYVSTTHFFPTSRQSVLVALTNGQTARLKSASVHTRLTNCPSLSTAVVVIYL